MAKRKRLSPAAMHGAPQSAAEAKSAFSAPPPIASVAREASQTAALETLATEMREARDTGRMIQALPLDVVQEDYLVRDRVALSQTEFDALVDSLRNRGQQAPIEVMALDNGHYGLISGWRRLRALRQLRDEDGAGGFTHVLAILRKPEDAAEAYLAMVEENEIREGLSYYERARIAYVAMEEGLYTTSYEALQALFSSASRAKRSKIGSFIRVHRMMGDLLEYPSLIPERLGLQLAKAIEDDRNFGPRLRKVLAANRNRTQDEEREMLEAALRTPRAPKPAGDEVAAGVFLSAGKAGVTLKGPGVTEDFLADLRAFLSAQN